MLIELVEWPIVQVYLELGALLGHGTFNAKSRKDWSKPEQTGHCMLKMAMKQIVSTHKTYLSSFIESYVYYLALVLHCTFPRI